MIPRFALTAIRLPHLALVLAAGLAAGSAGAQAQRGAATGTTQAQAQALLLETAGKWQAFSSQQGRAKICYALSKAETRSPANLKDVEALLFVSSRPGEGVRNEISLVMNFDEERFAMVAKGKYMFLKNPAEEPRMLDALRKGAGLEVKATSKRGNATSDKYSLAGLTQVIKRAEDACK